MGDFFDAMADIPLNEGSFVFNCEEPRKIDSFYTAGIYQVQLVMPQNAKEGLRHLLEKDGLIYSGLLKEEKDGYLDKNHLSPAEMKIARMQFDPGLWIGLSANTLTLEITSRIFEKIPERQHVDYPVNLLDTLVKYIMRSN